MVSTRGTRGSAGPPSRPVTQEQVSLSLVDILQNLAHQVPPERRPQVELLLKVVREKPDQQQKVKQQMLIVGGADACKRAVAAVVQGPRDGNAAALQETLPLPPLQSTLCMPTEAPELPMQALQAIFGAQSDAEEFKSSLLHSFHCFLPSCTVPGCPALRGKLCQLQQHVSTCSDSNDLLCRIWSYIKCLQPSAAAPPSNANHGDAWSAMRGSDLGLSSQLSLPNWGRTLLGSVQKQQSSYSSHGLDELGNSFARRNQLASTNSWFGGTGLPLPSGTSAASELSSTSLVSGGGFTSSGMGHSRLSAPLPLPSFDFSQAGPLESYSHMSGGRKRHRAVEVASAAAKKSSTYASSSGGSLLHVPLTTGPLSEAPAPSMPSMPAPMPFEKSRSINLSGNINLADMLKSASGSDLGAVLGLNMSTDSFGDLDVPLSGSGLPASASFTAANLTPGISLSKCKSALRGLNCSDLSLGGFLNEAELT